MNTQDKQKTKQNLNSIVAEINRQRCIMLALAAIVSALPDKSWWLFTATSGVFSFMVFLSSFMLFAWVTEPAG